MVVWAAVTSSGGLALREGQPRRGTTGEGGAPFKAAACGRPLTMPRDMVWISKQAMLHAPTHTHAPLPRPSVMFYRRFRICFVTLNELGNTPLHPLATCDPTHPPHTVTPLPPPLPVQYKPIRTVRFVVAGTIEERILKLQEKKQAVFEGTVGETQGPRGGGGTGGEGQTTDSYCQRMRVDTEALVDGRGNLWARLRRGGGGHACLSLVVKTYAVHTVLTCSQGVAAAAAVVTSAAAAAAGRDAEALGRLTEDDLRFLFA